jgi:hypothetical protein
MFIHNGVNNIYIQVGHAACDSTGNQTPPHDGDAIGQVNLLNREEIKGDLTAETPRRQEEFV